MSVFSTDSDILRFEPSLFGDLYFQWQVLSLGHDGQLESTVFSSATGNFITNAVQVGGVIYLKDPDGTLEGMYEITAVNSEMELTISVLRQSQSDAPVQVGLAADLYYRIGTYAPQSYDVMYELTQYFGIQPGNAESEYKAEDIYNKDVLRQASTHAVIAGVYATLASAADDADGYWKKSLYYQGLFEKARERCRLSIDQGNDGVSDRTIIGGSIRLIRD